MGAFNSSQGAFPLGADQFVQIAPASSGQKVDVTELTVGGNVVERQRVIIADPSNPSGLLSIGQQPMSGSLPVAIASDQNELGTLVRMQARLVTLASIQTDLAIQRSGMFVPQPDTLPFL
jgi:hypothetical protein